MGFSRQEYWSGVPLPSPNKMLVDINPLVSKWLRLETHHPLSQLRKHLDKFRFVATLCNPMNCSMPGFPVLHCLLEFAQTHVHWVGDAIQPSHPRLPPSPLALNLSQHRVFLCQWDGWIESSTKWTWVWANSRRQWRIGKPGVLLSTGSQNQTWPNDCTTTLTLCFEGFCWLYFLYLFIYLTASGLSYSTQAL